MNTTGIKISPNYQAQKLSEAELGSLFFLVNPNGSALPPIQPCLAIAEASSEVNTILRLSDSFGVHAIEKMQDPVVFTLMDEWRFSLDSKVPEIGSRSRVIRGKIMISEGGRLIEGMSTQPLSPPIFIYIDQMRARYLTDSWPDPRLDTFLISDWSIETRTDPSEPWKTLFDNSEFALEEDSDFGQQHES